MEKAKFYIIPSVIGILLFGLVFYFYISSQSTNPQKEDIYSENAEENTDGIKNNEQSDNPQNNISEDVVTGVPSIDRPIIAPSGMSEDKVALAREKIQELSAILKENSRLFSHWLDLGTYRKMIEDFDGAFEAWQYASVLQPNDARPYNNIGNLYVYYLHNNEEGEKYLLEAIEKSPDGLQYYAAAFEFYYYVLKDEKRGKDILEEGIARNQSTASPLRELLYSLSGRI